MHPQLTMRVKEAPQKRKPWGSRVTSLLLSPLHQFHAWKSQSQYLGRYSVEKLCAFHHYQENTSLWRVALVILTTPLPVFIILLLLDVVPMNDPRAGPGKNVIAFARSVVGHIILPSAILLSTKQALRLNDRQYSFRNIFLIGVGVSLSLEGFMCIPAAFVWHFPVPFREVTFTPFFMLFVGLFNWYFGKEELRRKWSKLKVYLPMVAMQFSMYYTFLSLAAAFTYISMSTQVVLVLCFPAVKLLVKNAVWSKARQLEDLTTDVTICFVELTGSLYQTVCLQFAKSQALQYVILFSDFFQALYEVRAYIFHEYITDGMSTVQTAVQIVVSGVFNGADERPSRVKQGGGLRTLVPSFLGDSSLGGSLFLKPKMVIANVNKRLLDLNQYKYDVDLPEIEYANGAATQRALTTARDAEEGEGVPMDNDDDDEEMAVSTASSTEGRMQGEAASASVHVTPKTSECVEAPPASVHMTPKPSEYGDEATQAADEEVEDPPNQAGPKTPKGAMTGRRTSVELSPRSMASFAPSQSNSQYGISRADTGSASVSSSALSPAQEAMSSGGRGVTANSILAMSQASPMSLLKPKTLPPLRREFSNEALPVAQMPSPNLQPKVPARRGSGHAFSVYDPHSQAGGDVPVVSRSSSIMATLIQATPGKQYPVAKRTDSIVRRPSKRNSTVHPGELDMAVVDGCNTNSREEPQTLLPPAEQPTTVYTNPLASGVIKQLRPATTKKPIPSTASDASSARDAKVINGSKDEGSRRRITRVMIDGIQLARADQARILEQTLQLLFSCEVLIFVEYLEVLMPSIYGLIVGGLWPLHNARYNMLFISMTHSGMQSAVAGSFIYAALESLSLFILVYIMKRRYGISALHLLAFVLEKYWKVLHGKMIGALLVIWLTLTVHQGVDFTFTYDYGVILERFGSWRTN